MLYTTVTPAQKRERFRELLAAPEIAQFPGAFTPLSTKLIQEQGFEGVYISGGVLANELGLPDIGLTTLTEVATRAGQIARSTDLPCLVDADTGFGEPMNVARTVQELEDAGLAGCHIEDQFNPKRCGHLDGKNVVDTATAVKRIRAAVEARRDPATKAGALARIGQQLGINPETLRNWVRQAEVDEGYRPGTTTDDAQRLAELEREVRELRRANAILRSASAFFAAELDRPHNR